MRNFQVSWRNPLRQQLQVGLHPFRHLSPPLFKQLLSSPHAGCSNMRNRDFPPNGCEFEVILAGKYLRQLVALRTVTRGTARTQVVHIMGATADQRDDVVDGPFALRHQLRTPIASDLVTRSNSVFKTANRGRVKRSGNSPLSSAATVPGGTNNCPVSLGILRPVPLRARLCSPPALFRVALAISFLPDKALSSEFFLVHRYASRRSLSISFFRHDGQNFSPYRRRLLQFAPRNP